MFVDVTNHKILLKKMTKVEVFREQAECKHGHCSSMSNSARFDLSSKADISKQHDKYPRSNCQKFHSQS